MCLQSRADQAVELKLHKSTNIGVNRGLLVCLKTREWLNDEVMNIFIGLLQVALRDMQCQDSRLILVH